MAGRSTSEEMDAVSFDDVTPPRPVSIYDLDEDIPTRMQSSDEIAEYQRKARERRDPTHRSFRKTSEPASPASGRPVPRESGPVLIDRPRSVPAEPELDLDQVLDDVAATISQLPPTPRVPTVEERSRRAAPVEPTPVLVVDAPPRARSVGWAVSLFVLTLAAIAAFVLTR